MNWKKWISIAAAVCLAVTAVPMRAVAQEELVQEKMLEEIKEEIKEEQQEEIKEELKEEKEEPKEEKEEKEEKEKLQEQSDEKTEPQEKSKKELLKGISLLMEGENSTAVSGNEAADFEGKGTAERPYLIEDVDDLKKLAEKVKNGTDYEGKHFKLTADIDLKNEEWTPIGTIVYTDAFGHSEIRFFKGTFDGAGHQIANLTISNGVEYAGLFGYVRNATIQNCNVTGEVNGYNHTGGIVGAVDGKTNNILNCSFQGNVTGNAYVGGIVGQVQNQCEVSGCYAIGTVHGGNDKVGGIAGSGVGTIKNCYALANVTATGVNAGGIAGYAFYVTIENCYYSGNVSAKNYNYAGGIAGTAWRGTIQNCVSLAESVSGSDYVNRIAGGIFVANLTKNHSYNRTQLVIDGKITYADTDNADTAVGKNVFVSAGRVMTDVPNQTLFNWVKNGFTEANGWSISAKTGLPYLREDITTKLNLSALPSKDLTIDQAPQHFTTKNIGNGFVVKVLSPTEGIGDTPFEVQYRLHDTDAWTSAVPNTAGTYDVKITRAADGDINPFACEISEGLVLTKKRSGGGSTATRTYTAQFDTNGGSAVDKVKTDKNGKIERPADPTKEGYIFVGWYSDSKLTKPFDFSAELTANSTLYAKWKENNEIILTIGSRKISVFGREIKNDVAPKIVNDRTMLPIRIVAESLGGTVTWNGELQRVTIQKGADVILITIGADTAYVNGTAVKLDAAAFVENGRTYLPLRFVSETLGAQVAWKEAEKTVTITK